MSGLVKIFVNGHALRGSSLSDALDGATSPAKSRRRPHTGSIPCVTSFGLLHMRSGDYAVPGELYELSYEMLRTRLLPREPAELEPTVIELARPHRHAIERMRRQRGEQTRRHRYQRRRWVHAYRASRSSGG